MEKWRRVWRDGILPQMTDNCLRSLGKALVEDDSRLYQGSTCYPPLLDSLRDRECEGACFLAFAGWQGCGLTTVGQVETYFQEICDHVDRVFNEPVMCRYFLNWYDDTPREEMRRELLGEIQLAIRERQSQVA